MLSVRGVDTPDTDVGVSCGSEGSNHHYLRTDIQIGVKSTHFSIVDIHILSLPVDIHILSLPHSINKLLPNFKFMFFLFFYLQHNGLDLAFH